MKTLNQLQDELKKELSSCNHENDGSLAAHVNEKIQWAWENWDIDFSKYFDGINKPEQYTVLFMQEWINNENFDSELDRINE